MKRKRGLRVGDTVPMATTERLIEPPYRGSRREPTERRRANQRHQAPAAEQPGPTINVS